MSAGQTQQKELGTHHVQHPSSIVHLPAEAINFGSINGDLKISTDSICGGHKIQNTRTNAFIVFFCEAIEENGFPMHISLEKMGKQVWGLQTYTLK